MLCVSTKLFIFLGHKGSTNPSGSGMFSDKLTQKLSWKDRFSKKGTANILRRSPCGLVVEIGHCSFRGKMVRSELTGIDQVRHFCHRAWVSQRWSDGKPGKQETGAFIHRGWPERHSLGWEYMNTRSKHEACERGAGACRKALASGTKWQVLFIEHSCLECSGKTLGRGRSLGRFGYLLLWLGDLRKGKDKIQEWQ